MYTIIIITKKRVEGSRHYVKATYTLLSDAYDWKDVYEATHNQQSEVESRGEQVISVHIDQ